MAKAVGGTTSVYKIPFSAQDERVVVPVLGVSRDHVEVAPDEGHDGIGGAWVLDDHVAATLHECNTLRSNNQILE